jgi:hypothetical protein
VYFETFYKKIKIEMSSKRTAKTKVIQFSSKLFPTKSVGQKDMVAQTSHHSSSAGRDQEDHGSTPA